MFQEGISALRVLNMLYHTLILLARILPLFVYNSGNSIPGNIIDSSRFAMVTFVGHCFLNSAYSLDVYNIAFLVDSQVCDQRNKSMFSKGLENI